MRRIAKCLGLLAVCTAVTCLTVAPVTVRAQSPGSPTPQAGAPTQQDSVRALVGRLDLEKYKATIKALTQFGDRRQGTDRNRAANDWIEAQLKSYGCSDVARLKYDYAPAQRGGGTGAAAGEAGRGGAAAGQAAALPGAGPSACRCFASYPACRASPHPPAGGARNPPGRNSWWTGSRY